MVKKVNNNNMIIKQFALPVRLRTFQEIPSSSAGKSLEIPSMRADLFNNDQTLLHIGAGCDNRSAAPHLFFIKGQKHGTANGIAKFNIVWPDTFLRIRDSIPAILDTTLNDENFS